MSLDGSCLLGVIQFKKCNHSDNNSIKKVSQTRNRVYVDSSGLHKPQLDTRTFASFPEGRLCSFPISI